MICICFEHWLELFHSLYFQTVNQQTPLAELGLPDGRALLQAKYFQFGLANFSTRSTKPEVLNHEKFVVIVTQARRPCAS